jgi:tRNA-binding EMAP/Myf-like protein
MIERKHKLMKKWFLVLCALMVLAAAPGLAQEQPASLSGVILDIQEDGSFLIDSDIGQVLVNMPPETVVEGVAKLREGQYVYVDYTGAMTKSMPPQVTAEKVRCYVIEGIVLSLTEDGKTALVDSQEYGQVMVSLPAMETALKEGDFVAAYFSGVMALSYPAQAGGLKVDVYVLATGEVQEIGEGYFLMDNMGQALRVNIGEESDLPESIEPGDMVTVYHNGQMTSSMPPQVFGLIVMQAPQGE